MGCHLRRRYAGVIVASDHDQRQEVLGFLFGNFLRMFNFLPLSSISSCFSLYISSTSAFSQLANAKWAGLSTLLMQRGELLYAAAGARLRSWRLQRPMLGRPTKRTVQRSQSTLKTHLTNVVLTDLTGSQPCWCLANRYTSWLPVIHFNATLFKNHCSSTTYLA